MAKFFVRRFTSRFLTLNISRKRHICLSASCRSDDDDDEIEVWQEILDSGDSGSSELCDLRAVHEAQGCFVVHPYVKWGREKARHSSPALLLEEAASLVRSVRGWRLCGQLAVPLPGLGGARLLGSGQLGALRDRLGADVTAVLVNVGQLRGGQRAALHEQLGVPVLDRRALVLQLLRQSARSGHARRHVALAELRQAGQRLAAGAQRDLLAAAERRLAERAAKDRRQRELNRAKRRRQGWPLVAAVGYTNAGKTSLVRALTDGETCQEGAARMFATLDVSVHRGAPLPCGMRALFADTVGFISDVPLALLECFAATLEDAALADVVLHVQDAASADGARQAAHVLAVLRRLAAGRGEPLERRLVAVGNKADLLPAGARPEQPCDVLVSARLGTGLAELRQLIERTLMATTDRQSLTLRLPTGGDEIRWLYKNASVVSTGADADDCEFQLVTVVISAARLQQFYARFILDT